MTGCGTVIASVGRGGDRRGRQPESGCTSSDNTVTFDSTSPTVTIDQAAGQADPSNSSPLNFTVMFSEAVTGFASGDVTLSGTAGHPVGDVTGGGTTYNVAVSGMTGSGTVIANVAAEATDAAGNPNLAAPAPTTP